MRQRKSIVEHNPFISMNSFNCTVAAIFSMQAILPEDFPYSDIKCQQVNFILDSTVNSYKNS